MRKGLLLAMFIVKLVLSSVTILKVFMFMGSKGKVSKECIANTPRLKYLMLHFARMEKCNPVTNYKNYTNYKWSIAMDHL